MGVLSQTLGMSLNSQVVVHSIQDATTFATGSGALVSLLRVDGLMVLMGQSEAVRRKMDAALMQNLAPS